MTIWSFGASFAHLVDNENEQWLRIVANSLDTNLRSYALTGSSSDLIFEKFNHTRHLIKENDIVILSFAAMERRWFIHERPDRAQIFSSLDDDKKENNAIKNYRKYLDNTIVPEIYILNFLYNLHSLTKKLNLHTILLITFPDLITTINNVYFPLFNISKGLLYNVSFNEIVENDHKALASIYNNDLRLNHLCKSNHIILANKIIKNIKEKTPIDLTQDFIKNILNEDNINDHLLVKDELFDYAATTKIHQIPWRELISKINNY